MCRYLVLTVVWGPWGQCQSLGTGLLETFFEDNVGQGPRLWETIDAVADLKVNPAIGVDVVLEAEFVDKFCWGGCRSD